MATVTAFTAARTQEIEDNMIIGASIVSDHLILEKLNAPDLDAGDVRGPDGATGAAGNGGVVWKYNLNPLSLDLRQCSNVESSQVIASSLTIPTVIGRRYAYALSGVMQFELATGVAAIRVFHGATLHTTLYQDVGGVANAIKDINRVGRTWVATANNFSPVSFQIVRISAASTGAFTILLDTDQGGAGVNPAAIELWDVGALP